MSETQTSSLLGLLLDANEAVLFERKCYRQQAFYLQYGLYLFGALIFIFIAGMLGSILLNNNSEAFERIIVQNVSPLLYLFAYYYVAYLISELLPLEVIVTNKRIILNRYYKFPSIFATSIPITDLDSSTLGINSNIVKGNRLTLKLKNRIISNTPGIKIKAQTLVLHNFRKTEEVHKVLLHSMNTHLSKGGENTKSLRPSYWTEIIQKAPIVLIIVAPILYFFLPKLIHLLKF